MSKPRLVPCPFCGSTDLFVDIWAPQICVTCYGCNCEGPTAETTEWAIELWNRSDIEYRKLPPVLLASNQ